MVRHHQFNEDFLSTGQARDEAQMKATEERTRKAKEQKRLDKAAQDAVATPRVILV